MKFTKLIAILLVASGTVSCSREKMEQPQPVPAPQTPAAVLKFDGNLLDSMGKINVNSIIMGAPLHGTDRFGNANSALYLDGGTRFTYGNVLLKGKAVTLATWVKVFSLGGGLHFFARVTDDKSVALSQISDKFGTSVSVPGTNSVQSNTIDNAWHHLAMTYDGQEIKLYVDGVLANSVVHEGSIGDAPKELVLGGFLNTNWKGYIDDLRIYSEVKTAAQIEQIFKY